MTVQVNQHYLYPGALYVDTKPTQITTILGTCVAVCLYDNALKFGGMNHYLLPLWNGEGLASPRYGNIAIEKLIERMMENGSLVSNLQAKIFGGKVDERGTVYNIGQRNIEIAETMLEDYKIPIISKSVGQSKGRKILFLNHTGEVFMKYLNS